MSLMKCDQVITKYVLCLSKKPKKRRLVKGEDTEFENCVPNKKTKDILSTPIKRSYFHVGLTMDEINAFFAIFDDTTIQEFLNLDSCCRVSDKYLLAMVLTYFKRAHLHVCEYNNINFFTALYLANDMEEDEEEFKYEIFPWALGDTWRDLYPGFLAKREQLWMKMKHRAAVSRKTCEQVMGIEPDHYIWSRERSETHAGAKRTYVKSIDEKEPYPRGPGRSPIPCEVCIKMNNSSGYYSDDSVLSDDVNILHVSDSSPDVYFSHKPVIAKTAIQSLKEEVNSNEDSSFDMEKLWDTLT
uniref:Uncharacterized protein n=2 Tax=Ciona savignyi TaxID=51511 RepID=H2Y7E9_CIOSA